MKTTEIAKKYNIDADNFFYFLQQAKLKYNEGLISITVADENVDLYVKKYMEFLKNKKEEQLKLKEEEKKKNPNIVKLVLLFKVIKVAQMMYMHQTNNKSMKFYLI